MGLRPVANVSLEIDGKYYEEFSDGDGQYDAFVKSLRKIYKRLGKQFPKLIDYVVTIPPGGKTDALVEAVITWKGNHEFKTKGLDPDQNTAALKATIRMLNIIENDFNPGLLDKIMGAIS
jgi:D-citramalate synthase